MANIKISQLPSIGNSLSASTILPVVNTSGNLTTDKVAVGNIANFTLTQAGNTLPPAFVANVAYSVTNAAQPNITSVGTLTGLSINSVNTLRIPGGVNGQYLQTNGNGVLSWASGGGSGNGTVGGANSQIQFNLNGNFAGDPELTWDAGNNQLNTVNFAASSATIYGNVNAVNVNATGNLRPNAIYTDHYYYANGYAFGGGGGNGTPGGANTQIQFNDAGAFAGNTGFTFNKTTGVFTSPFLAGNGNGLSNIQGANVSGAVNLATFAGTANAVAGANVSGQVSYAATANSVAVANVVGIGNIATLSLNGNSSQILYGNGVFAASSTNPFDQDLNTTDNVTFANITSTDAIRFSNSSNIVGALGYAPTYVSIEGYGSNAVNITANDTYTWSFGNTGLLTFPGTPRISTDANNFEVQAAEAVNFEANTVVNIYTDTSNNGFQWQFGDDGNLTLPGNTFAVKYANGTPVSISGGGNVSQLVNDGNSFVLDSDGSVIFEGTDPGQGVNRGLEWDYGANANGVNSMVRQDMNGITVRAWTGQGGGANGFSAPVNIVTNQDATENKWVFDGQGNLTLPGNLNIPTGNIVSNIISPAFTSGITSVDVSGNANVTITVSDELFEGEISGRVTISGVNAPVQVNGNWWYQAIDFDRFQLYTDANLTTPVDGSSWPGYAGPGGTAVGIGSYSNLTVQAGNISVRSNSKTWQFDTNGNLTVPSNSSINAINDGGQLGAQVLLNPDLGQSRISARSIEYSQNFTSTDWSNAEYTGTQVNISNAAGLLNFVANNSTLNASIGPTFSINGGNRLPYQGYSGSGSNVIIYTDVTASPDPTNVTSIEFYYQTQSSVGVDYDDGALNIAATGLTIYLDNSQTQNPDIWLRSGDDITLQAKDKALGTESEGGDINIYAGDGAGDDGTGNIASSGGDIQIVGGQGGLGNSSSGSGGGFARLQGGDGGDAGVSSVAGQGGYVQISAGDGGYNGGNAQLGAQGGYVTISAGQTTIADGVGGNVTISSGTAGDGNGIAGNVQIITPTSATANGGTWTFDGRGNLNLPLGGSISEGPSPSYLGNAVTITPAGGSDPNQQLKVYPTVAEGNHLHLTSGNLEVTDVFLGDDRQYIRTTTTEGMTIGTGGGEVFGGYAWSFDDSGTLTLPNGSNIANGALNGGTPSASVALNAFSPSGDTVSIQAQGNTSSAVISIFSNAGPVTSNWTFTTAPLDPNESFLYIPNGGAISTPDATGGEGGKNIFIQAGASDPVTWNSNPGGELMLKGGYGSFGDGGGGAGGNVNIEGGASSDSHAGNVNISSGLNTWVFDYNGNLTVPGNLVYIGASPAPSISGFNSVSAEEFTNDTSNVTINANSNTWNFDSTGNLTIPGSSGGVIKTVANGAIAIAAIDNGSDNPAQLLSINANGTATTAISSYANQATIQANINGDIKTWAFTNTGNLVLPGNTFSVNYANGTQVSLGGNISNISNGNSNVVVNANSNVIISTNGNSAVMDVGADGRVRMINGPKIIGGNIVAGDGYVQFASSTLTMFGGNIQLLGGGYIKGPGGINVIQLNSPENGSARISNNFAVGSSNTGNITGGNITLSGNISANTNGFALGYRDVPQVVASNTTLAATDGGKHYYSTTAANITLTIPNNATTSFATGTAISIVVQAAGNVLVNAASGVTLYMAGNSTAANRYVNAYGMATLLKVGTDTWFINGTGVN